MKAKKETLIIRNLKSSLEMERKFSKEKDEKIEYLETTITNMKIKETLRLNDPHPKCIEETAKERAQSNEIEKAQNSLTFLVETVKMQNRLINKVVPPNTINK